MIDDIYSNKANEETGWDVLGVPDVWIKVGSTPGTSPSYTTYAVPGYVPVKK